MTIPSAVVFDLGGVLIDWDPRYLYRTLFDDEAEMERFLTEVTTPEWNLAQDAGRSWAEAVETLAALHPERRTLIEAFHLRWPDTLGGPIDGTVVILDELRRNGVRLFALSNWSAETFPVAREQYRFLDWFEGIVVSGEEGIVKPDPRIFELLAERHALDPTSTVFIDDNASNVEAATALEFIGIRFSDPATLRAELETLALLPSPVLG